MDWDKLRVFHAVAQAGSFTHAGETLGLSQSAASRQISSLEDDLGVQLFHRHARGLILTEQGELLYRTAREVFDRLEAVKTSIADSREHPEGDLRVTTTVGFGSTWLTPRLKHFVERYPHINLSVICDDRELDLGMREADVAIRMSEPTQPDLVKKRLFTVHTHIYASPEYVRTHGAPETVEELDDHAIIAYGDNAPPSLRNVNWLRTIGTRPPQLIRPVRLQVNNIYGLLLAVESGMGIGVVPDYMITGNNNLRQVLPEVNGPSFDTFFVYPEELRNMKRVTVFRDFLEDQVQRWRF
jgi:DNA-binding transcriptional LysR family regulator